MVRIKPDTAIVEEVAISKEELKRVQKITAQPNWIKKGKLYQVRSINFCCVCRAFESPMYRVKYPSDSGKGQRIEIFCRVHINECYYKTKDKTLDEIASDYGIQRVESIPHYHPEYTKSGYKK